MATPILADVTDIADWADRRDAQSTLPQLVRRLVLATTPAVEKLSFRSGEGVNLPGWDGVVVTSEGHAFLPIATSGWELSTSADVGSKANSDYDSRTEDPKGLDPSNASYVAVSARRWPNKEDWAASKQSEGKWREVRAYDADDLHTWLEMAPAVHAWFSIQIGKYVEGITDLKSDHRGTAGTRSRSQDGGSLPAARDLERDVLHLWTAPLRQEGSGARSGDDRLQTSMRRHRVIARPNGKSAHTLLGKWSASRAIIKDRV